MTNLWIQGTTNWLYFDETMPISIKYLSLKKKLSSLASTIFGISRAPFLKSQFAIKRGYLHRKYDRYFNDLLNTDEYQKEVYLYARRLMSENNFRRIADIGCGSGYKLVNYLAEYETLGIDLTETVRFLESKYPDREWMEIDQFRLHQHSTEMIICADVIEHLVNPDTLLQDINRIQHWKYLIISTPERDLRRGKFSYGPPENEYHVREWNSGELIKYLSNYCKIENHFISNKEQCTQVVLCSPLLRK